MASTSFIHLYAWAPDKNADLYHVRVYGVEPAPVVDKHVETSFVALRLDPGEYRVVVHSINEVGIEAAVAIVSSTLVVKP